MFGLFQKKTALLPLLNGLKDIHNHLLPGIDDGAPNLEISLELVRKYKDLGITEFYATPHTMGDYYPNTVETIKRAHQQLNEGLMAHNLSDVKVYPSSEYMVDLELEDRVKNDALLPLKGNHVLVEMSYLRASENFNEVIYQLQLKGFTPILAHPERYLYYIDDATIFTQMKNKGIKLQLNALSLSKYYGDKITKKAYSLLNDGLYDFIGLDTHKMRHLNVLEKIMIPQKNAKLVTGLIANNNTLF